MAVDLAQRAGHTWFDDRSWAYVRQEFIRYSRKHQLPHFPRTHPCAGIFFVP